jgi:hypothetical protein
MRSSAFSDWQRCDQSMWNRRLRSILESEGAQMREQKAVERDRIEYDDRCELIRM